MDPIKIIKLISGEEIITKSRNDSDDCNIIINDPLKFIVTSVKNGQAHMDLTPFIMAYPEGKDIKLHSKGILAEIEEDKISKQLKDEYIHRTTGLVMSK